MSHVSHNLNVKTIAFYEKNRFQHTKYWTGHMNNLSLYERRKMEHIINDNSFYSLIQKKLII